jgi:hypothetical protein
MVKRRCQDWDCDLTIDDSIIDEPIIWEKTFSFPKLNLSVKAKNLEEAEKKVKALVEWDYENKSI